MADNMKWLQAGAVVAGAAAVGFYAGKSKGAKGPSGFLECVGDAQKKVVALSPAEAKEYISAKRPLIIEVRDTGDVGEDAIKGAVSIPLSNIVFAADQDFALTDDIKVKGVTKIPKGTSFCHEKLKGSKNQPILVSCGLGGQALIAAKILVDYGYTEVRAVDGGNMAWMDSSGEVCDCVHAPKPLPIALLFNGQGAQYVKMLEGVKDTPAVKDMLAKAKPILGYDILDICVNGPETKLEETKHCQPAMFIAGLAGMEKLRGEREEAVTRASVVAGLSLGEYTALCAAGVLTFEDGLKLVKLRGEAMQEAAAMSKQSMLSVSGLDRSVLEPMCKEVANSIPGGVCSISNSLMPKGYACGGTTPCIEALKPKAEAAGALQAKVLKTAGAFHTTLMKPAQDKLAAALEQALPNMKPPKCTVWMNVTAQPVEPGSDPAVIVNNLKKQLTNPVLWEDSMNGIINSGIDEFYECGPMKQLKAMMKRINVDKWKQMTNVEV